MMCRVGAKELSAIKPSLDLRKVKLVGIGLEELGVQEFIDGKFFAGDVYIDYEKECYKRLAFKRFNMLTILPAVFGSKGRETAAKGREMGVGNNFKGDGMQNGGILVVSAGGEKTLFFWPQPTPADHVDPEMVLASLGVEQSLL